MAARMRTVSIAAIVCVLVAHVAAQNMMINPTFQWGAGWWNHHGSFPAFDIEAGVSQDTGSDCVKIVSSSTSSQNGMWQNSDPTLATEMANVWSQYSVGKNFKFSGWSKPTSVVPLEGPDVTSEMHYSIWMTAKYSDTSEETTVISPFDRFNENWQQASGIIVPLAGKTVKNVVFNAFLREHSGSALFDNYVMETYQPVADATNSYLLSKPDKADLDADVHVSFLVRDQENAKFVLASNVQAVVTGPSQPTVTITPINGNNNERDIKFNFPSVGQYSVSISVNGVEADTWSVTVEDIPLNYITDPSFEIFNGLWALSGSATLIDDSAQCNSGNKCIRMVTGNDNWVGNWNLPVGQATASQVVFSAFFKTDGLVPEPLTGQTLGFYLDVKGPSGELDHLELNFDHTATTWTEFRYPYNPTFPISSVGFYVMSRWVGAGGEFWVDDVAIEQPISAAPSASESSVEAPSSSYLARTSHPLTITSRDSEGIVSTTGGANFNAKITRSIDSFVRNLEILDMQNGQYSVDVWAPSAGNWKLEVFLDSDLVYSFDILFYYDLGMELVSNPGFENLQSGTMMNWTPVNLGFTISSVASTGARSIKCESASGDVTHGATQDIFVNQASPAPLVLTASSRGESTGTLDADYAVTARVTLANGEVMPDDFVIAFPKQSADWALGSVLIAAPSAIRSVLITARFANHVGYAYFDDISLTTAQASAHGPMSVCSGAGINSAEVNVDATFTVHARDSFGIPLLGGTNPSDVLTATLSYNDAVGSVLSLQGTVTPSSVSPSYSVTYKPVIYGRHTLEVKINGEHVGASPFTLYVNPDFEGPSELIENPSLNTESTAGGSAAGWAPFGTFTWTDDGCRSGHCAAVVSTGATFVGGVSQTAVAIPADRNEYSLRFSAWTRASGLVAQPGLADYSLYVDVVYTDGTTATVWRDLAWDQDQWHFEEIVFKPARAIQSASFYALFRNIAEGSAYFDDFSVHMTAPTISPAMSIVSRAATTDGSVGEQETITINLKDKTGYPIASTSQDISDFAVEVVFLNGCTGLLETVTNQIVAGTNAGEMLAVFTPQAGGEYFVKVFKASTNEEFSSSPIQFNVVAAVGEGATVQQGSAASGSQSSSSGASTGQNRYKIGSVELFSKGALSHALSAGAAFCTTMIVLVAVNVVISKSSASTPVRPPVDRATTSDTVAEPVDADEELRTISGRTINNMRRRTQSDRDPARMNDAILKTGKVF